MRAPSRSDRIHATRFAARWGVVWTFGAGCLVLLGGLLAGAHRRASGARETVPPAAGVAPPALGVESAPHALRGPRVAPTMESDAPLPAAEPRERPGARDGEEVGPVPSRYADLEVVRSGRDLDGWPTWWHADGTITKRAEQRVVDEDGVVHRVPVVLHFLSKAPRRR